MQLFNGDCLEVMKSIPDASIDAIITDPPYGTTACKWDSVIPFDLMWEQLNRIIKPNGAIVLFGSQPFTSILVTSNLKMFKYEWIWKKERPTNPLLCKKQPPKYHENILVFYKKQPTFNPTFIKRKEENKRNNKPREYKDNTKIDTNKYSDMVLSGNNDLIYSPNILEISMQRGMHPTQKPVALIEYLIKTYTNENETVLDFTMGSGTTGVACKNTNRNFIGIELDKNYFEIAKKRIEETPIKLF
jgi:DNA modification methylase